MLVSLAIGIDAWAAIYFKFSIGIGYCSAWVFVLIIAIQFIGIVNNPI